MTAWPRGTKRAELAGRDGPMKRIHVNKHIIAANGKHGRNDPAITIQTSAGSIVCRAIVWDGPSAMIHGQLPCGAKIWIETRCALGISL